MCACCVALRCACRPHVDPRCLSFTSTQNVPVSLLLQSWEGLFHLQTDQHCSVDNPHGDVSQGLTEWPCPGLREVRTAKDRTFLNLGVWSGPDSNVFSWARVCLWPPQTAPTTRAPASLPVPLPNVGPPLSLYHGGTGGGVESSRAGHPALVPSCTREPATHLTLPSRDLQPQLQSPPQQSRDRRGLPGSSCFLAL